MREGAKIDSQESSELLSTQVDSYRRPQHRSLFTIPRDVSSRTTVNKPAPRGARISTSSNALKKQSRMVTPKLSNSLGVGTLTLERPKNNWRSSYVNAGLPLALRRSPTIPIPPKITIRSVIPSHKTNPVFSSSITRCPPCRESLSLSCHLEAPCALGVGKLKMPCGCYHVGRFQFNIAVSPSVVLKAVVKTGGVYAIRQKEGRRNYDVGPFGNGNGDDSRLGDSFSLYGGAVSRLRFLQEQCRAHIPEKTGGPRSMLCLSRGKQ